ncbi:hypothetical protein [Trichococcus shcherbakoviae]|uniref:hypothetical protein n=1 Tax=Trichococcus shcherbakoviae TaxID=2094020 RepID=UPI002AA619A5|nr:hypothetical protein [Trichococcus shcherbakoviae]
MKQKKQYIVVDNVGTPCSELLCYPDAVRVALKNFDLNATLPYVLITEKGKQYADIFKVRRDGTVHLLENFRSAWMTGGWPQLPISQISNEEIAAVKLNKRLHMRIRFWHWIAAMITGCRTLHKLKAMADATSPGTCCIPRSIWEQMTLKEKKNLFSYAEWHRIAISIMWQY